MYSSKNLGWCKLSIIACQGITTVKNKIEPTTKYLGLKISLNLPLTIETKNIVPKGITNPGIPFAHHRKAGEDIKKPPKIFFVFFFAEICHKSKNC